MATKKQIEAADTWCKDNYGGCVPHRILGAIIDAALPLAGERLRELETQADEQLKRLAKDALIELVALAELSERREVPPAAAEATRLDAKQWIATSFDPHVRAELAAVKARVAEVLTEMRGQLLGQWAGRIEAALAGRLEGKAGK